MDPFRNDLHAAHAKIEKLETEAAELEARASAAERDAEEARAGIPRKRTMRALLVAGVLGCAIASAVITIGAVLLRKDEPAAPTPSTVIYEPGDPALRTRDDGLDREVIGVPMTGPETECVCQPGDPLPCLCGIPAVALFDRHAAGAALATVDVQPCKTPRGPTGVGHVTITFSPTGRVVAAVVDAPPFAGTPTAGCIASAFRRVHTSPFAGDGISVGKTFTLR